MWYVNSKSYILVNSTTYVSWEHVVSIELITVQGANGRHYYWNINTVVKELKSFDFNSVEEAEKWLEHIAKIKE